jgi:hypothetical protein
VVWTLSAPNKFQHRFTGFEYNHKRSVVDEIQDPGRESPVFGNFDFPFSDYANINRAGFEYQGEFWAADWAKSAFGYRYENENGFVGDLNIPPLTHALRRNHEVYGHQVLTWKRLSAVVGGRFVHNESFGNKGVPRIELPAAAGRRLAFGNEGAGKLCDGDQGASIGRILWDRRFRNYPEP